MLKGKPVKELFWKYAAEQKNKFFNREVPVSFSSVSLRKKPMITVLSILVLLDLGAVLFAQAGDLEILRERMVQQQIIARGVTDARVIQAIRKVPRHLFVPERLRAHAYEDAPLPIGEGQTISQPYIIAVMTEALNVSSGDRVLEIGTGSGYQTAVLAEVAQEVYTVEIISSLAERARQTLENLGYMNIHGKTGDGYQGWPEKAPFDAVIVTCAPEKIPQPLVTQLREGGRMVIPVGDQSGVQKLIKGVKQHGEIKVVELMPVLFVPMVKGKP